MMPVLSGLPIAAAFFLARMTLVGDVPPSSLSGGKPVAHRLGVQDRCARRTVRQQKELACLVFGDRGSVLDPVAVIGVANAVDKTNAGTVNVSANDAVKSS